DLTVLRLLPIRVGLIDVVDRVQTPHSRVFNIPHPMVRVQRFLKTQRRVSGICDRKLEAQLGTERGALHQTKFGGPPSLSPFVALGEHADGDGVADLRYRLELPRCRAHEPMRRRSSVVRLACKPGETDWHAAANCVAVLPARL